MPILSKPVLSITVVSNSPNAKVSIKGKLTLTADDKAALATGLLKTELVAELWGQDDNPDPDNKLFTFAKIKPTDTLEYSFSQTISKSVLNEDHSVFEGGPGDEIYGRVAFRFTSDFLPTKPPVVTKSNVVSGRY